MKNIDIKLYKQMNLLPKQHTNLGILLNPKFKTLKEKTANKFQTTC